MTNHTIPKKFRYEPHGITDKSIIVTGGTTGIGRSTALLLASQGAKVLIFGRHEKELNDALSDIKNSLQDSGGEVYGLTADVAEIKNVKHIFGEADKRLDGVDILINNAGIPARSILTTNYEDMCYAIRTNLVGYLVCAKEAIPRMIKRGSGQIVNIGSLSGMEREADADIYVSAKAGLEGFSESLRKLVNEKGIKVTHIDPGSVGTDLTDIPPKEQRILEEQGYMLKAEDIANAVFFALTQPERSDIIHIQIRPHRQII